jgi:membrane protease YdiL (CAAX protease family)
MSQADGSSATVKSSEKIDLQITAVAGGRLETILVLAMVLAPVPLAIILVATGVLAMAGCQIVRGVPVEIPTSANLQLYGLLAYVAVNWIDVVAVWLWSARRALRRDVFVFHGPTWAALTASIVWFVIAMYGAPIMTHWLSHMTGGRGPQVRIDFHDTQSVAIYVLLFMVTAPVCEEILYRGLLVAWFRRMGWRDSTIWLAGSLIFGANHLIPLGFVWSAVMVVFGAVLFALRLRYDSLTPAWLTHFLFNAQPFLTYPLLTWLAPALLPGHLS